MSGGSHRQNSSTGGLSRFAAGGPAGPGGRARRRRSPESEDLPVAPDTEPLAEGGFVFRRLFVLALAALVLAPAAFAATVHVRVEGKTQTIFGAAEPTLQATTALDSIEAASLA